MNITLRLMLLSVAMMLFGFSARAGGINEEQVKVKAYTSTSKSVADDSGTSQAYNITVNVETMGTFSDALLAAMAEAGCEDMADISRLTVTGNINNDDLNYIRDNVGATLDALDLGEVTVWDNSLGYEALRGCSFEEVVLPRNLYSIYVGALEGCMKLKTIDIPGSVKSITQFCTRATSLETVTGGDGIEHVSDAFSNCPNLKSPVIFNNIFCRLPMNTIGVYEVPEYVTQIAGSAMDGVEGLTSVTIPDGVTEVGSYMLLGCDALTSITLGNGIMSIPYGFAANCENLEEVTVGKKVNRIEGKAFYGGNIKHVYCLRKTPPVWESSAWEGSFYGGINPDAVLHVSSNCVNLYENADGWKDFPTIVGDLDAYQTYDIAVNVETMGTFSEALQAAMAEAGCEDMLDISRLTVTGNINNDDLNYIRDNVGATLDALDLGEVTVEDNRFGYEALRGCGFKEVILPKNLENLDDWSILSECANLKTLDIPSSVNSIFAGLCDGASSLETVTGGEGVTYVAEFSDNFNRCPNLKSPVILNNIFCRLPVSTVGAYEVPCHVTRIAHCAMVDVDGLTSVTIPDGVTEVGESMLNGCDALTCITLGNGVATIPSYFAQDCKNLEEVTIGKKVIRIGREAFYGGNIKHVYCLGKNPPLWEWDNSFYGGINPDAVLHVSSNCVDRYENADGWKDFPTIVGDLEAYLTYDIAVNVETMGTFNEALLAAMAEAGCEDMADISSLTVTGNINNDDLNYIRDNVGATLDALDLGEVTVEDNRFGENTLRGCGFEEVILPKNLEYIENSALEDCVNLKTIDIPSSVKSIDYFCSEATSLETVTGGDGIANVYSSFAGCPNLKSPVILNNIFCRLPMSTVGAYVVPEHVTRIAHGAMVDVDGLTSVTIPDGVTEVGKDMLNGCDALTCITLGNGVTTIPGYFAAWCENLEEVTIGKKVNSIGWDAFYSGNIKHVYCLGKTPPVWEGYSSFYGGINPDAVLHVSSNCVDRYENADGWKNFQNIVGDLDAYPTYDIAVNVETMGTFSEALQAAMAEAGCEDMADISRLTVTGNINNDDLNYIRDNVGATLDALDLGEVTVEDNSFDYYALSNCLFEEVVLPRNLEYCWGMLSGCTYLKTLDIPSSVKEIGEICYGARSLETVTGGDGIEFVFNAFSNCPNLKSPIIFNNIFCRLPMNTVGAYVVPEHITEVCSNMLEGCNALTSITLGNGVATIPSYFAQDCKNLEEVTIGKKVSRIGREAFYGGNIKHVYCLGKIPPLWEGDNSFYGGINPDAVLHVSSNCVDRYENADGWKDFPTIVGDLDAYPTYDIAVNVETMGTFSEALQAAMAEAGCEDMADISRLTVTGFLNDNDIDYIGDNIGCTLDALDLGEVTMESNRIWTNAFHTNCSFEELILPNNLEYLTGYDMLCGCQKLKTLDIPNSVKIIEMSLGQFCSGATSLEAVTGGDGIEIMNSVVFGDCPNLKSPVILNNFFCRLPMNTVGAYVVPEHVTRIARWAMKNVNGLTSLTLPASVNYIGDNAFDASNNLKDIYCFATEVPYAEESDEFDKASCTLHVYENMVEAFMGDEFWADFNIVGDLDDMKDKLVTNRYDMAQGWNWVSTNIATEAAPYIRSIGDKVSRLVSQTDELVNDPSYGIVGTLKTLDVTSGYKLQTKEETTLEQYGIITTPSEVSVQLTGGWNWIGYLPTQTLSVATALSDLQVASGDRLVGQNSFAIYGDNGWEGSLEMMNPGEGYMYFRTTDATAFNYPDKAEDEPLNANKPALRDGSTDTPWSYDIHRYPDVTTIVARLYTEDKPLDLAAYSVGVFCGDECRGVGQQVGDKLFITVHGTVADKEDIVFRAYEHATGETLPISETITFLGQMLGDLTSPMELHVQSGATGISDIPALPEDARAIYSPAGKRLRHPQQGVNIIVNADGTTQKIIVK